MMEKCRYGSFQKAKYWKSLNDGQWKRSRKNKRVKTKERKKKRERSCEQENSIILLQMQFRKWVSTILDLETRFQKKNLEQCLFSNKDFFYHKIAIQQMLEKRKNHLYMWFLINNASHLEIDSFFKGRGGRE